MVERVEGGSGGVVRERVGSFWELEIVEVDWDGGKK